MVLSSTQLKPCWALGARVAIAGYIRSRLSNICGCISENILGWRIYWGGRLFCYPIPGKPHFIRSVWTPAGVSPYGSARSRTRTKHPAARAKLTNTQVWLDITENSSNASALANLLGAEVHCRAPAVVCWTGMVSRLLALFGCTWSQRVPGQEGGGHDCRGSKLSPAPPLPSLPPPRRAHSTARYLVLTGTCGVPHAPLFVI